MKLWLDDVRPAPEGWTHVKTAGQAIGELDAGSVSVASLDYDVHWDPVGDDENWQDRRTGFAVAKWMADNNVWPPLGVFVHSNNKEGRERMIAMLGEHYQEGEHF